jgi:metal-responsive CopG/Arc/MetJ family transcriptional regulator
MREGRGARSELIREALRRYFVGRLFREGCNERP